MVKKCFRCLSEKDAAEFYKHPSTADGFLGKCKRCTNEDVSKNRNARRQQYKNYERRRFSTPERKAKVAEYQRAHRMRHPEKYTARNILNNAVRDGRVIKYPCEVCGDAKSQGHHADYSKPLEVRWLCFKHHRELGHGQIVLPF